MYAKQYERPLPLYSTQAEQIAALYDSANSKDWKVRRRLFSKLPDSFAIAIAKEYIENYRSAGRDFANILVQEVCEELNNNVLNAGCTDDEIIYFAKRKAKEFRRLRYQFLDQANAVQVLSYLAFHRYGIYPPIKCKLGGHEVPVTVPVTGKDSPVTVTVSVTGVLNRLCDEHWWRRALRNITLRKIEATAIKMGLVRNVTKYVSNETFERIRKQKRRNRKILEQTFAINELEQEYSLQALSDLSISNPKLKRNELMARLAGFDSIAVKMNHIGMVYTITCPSRMHARHQKSDSKNAKYDGTTPKQASEYLNKIWQRVRSALDKKAIRTYGFRVAEPHQDATPHWHILLYMKAEHVAMTTAIIRKYALEDSPNESGALEHRVDAIKIDRKKGTGVSYIAKYISKGIDGYGLDTDKDGSDINDTPHRIKAWAVTWGNRQFQQIGGAPVTIWRELRKLSGNNLTGLIRELWIAADKGAWDEYTMLMGGPQANREDFPVRLAKQWSDEPNRYQEPSGNQIIGLEYQNVVFPTKLHNWIIQYRPENISADLKFLGL